MTTKTKTKTNDGGLRKPAPMPKGARRAERPKWWAFGEDEPGPSTVTAELLTGTVVDAREITDWGKHHQSFTALVLDDVDADGEAVEGKVAVKCVGNLKYDVRDAELVDEVRAGVRNRIRLQYLGKSSPTGKRQMGRHEFDLVILGVAE